MQIKFDLSVVVNVPEEEIPGFNEWLRKLGDTKESRIAALQAMVDEEFGDNQMDMIFTDFNMSHVENGPVLRNAPTEREREELHPAIEGALAKQQLK